jgi:hypothetical protein
MFWYRLKIQRNYNNNKNSSLLSSTVTAAPNVPVWVYSSRLCQYLRLQSDWRIVNGKGFGKQWLRPNPSTKYLAFVCTEWDDLRLNRSSNQAPPVYKSRTLTAETYEVHDASKGQNGIFKICTKVPFTSSSILAILHRHTRTSRHGYGVATHGFWINVRFILFLTHRPYFALAYTHAHIHTQSHLHYHLLGNGFQRMTFPCPTDPRISATSFSPLTDCLKLKLKSCHDRRSVLALLFSAWPDSRGFVEMGHPLWGGRVCSF